MYSIFIFTNEPPFFQVVRTFSSGTFRYGPLNSVSVVGTANEEVGGYFPDFLSRLEANPFLQKVKKEEEENVAALLFTCQV